MPKGLIQYNNLYFTTSTILGWKKLLDEKKNVDFIFETFAFLNENKRFKLYAFVIMPNHMHLLYEVLPDYTNTDIKHSILSYSSKKILAKLNDSAKFSFLVNKSNKEYQIWKGNSLSVEIITNKFFLQKLHYIHNNPSTLGLDAEQYELSSYPSYLNGEPLYDFLTLW